MRLWAMVPVLAIASACSNSGSAGPSSGQAKDTPPSLAALETKAGLTHCDNSGGQLYTRENGICSVRSDQDVTLATFINNSNRDQWVQAGSQFGGIVVTGDRWAAAVTSGQKTASALAHSLGGTVQ